MSDPQAMLAKIREDRVKLAAGDERTLKKVKYFPELLDRGVQEVLLEYATEEKDWEETLAELAVWPFTYSEDAEPGNPLTVRTWGSWDEVYSACLSGWITTAQYWQLASVVGRGCGVIVED